MKPLFLDFDGVLNSDAYIEASHANNISPNEAERQSLSKMLDLDENLNSWGLLAKLRMISPDMISNLNTIIEATGAKVVISSAWRKSTSLGNLRIILEHNGFKGEIIGSTPMKFGYQIRAQEIRNWFRYLSDPESSIKASDIESFVILDDDPSPGAWDSIMSNNFIETDPLVGLTAEQAQRAIAILSTCLPRDSDVLCLKN